MDYQQHQLLRWLREHPCLSISCLEIKAELPKDTLRHFVNERRAIPEKYFKKILNTVADYGYGH